MSQSLGILSQIYDKKIEGISKEIIKLTKISEKPTTLDQLVIVK